MKLAWLCQKYEGDTEFVILLNEPEDWQYFKITPIVYAEIQQ